MRVHVVIVLVLMVFAMWGCASATKGGSSGRAVALANQTVEPDICGKVQKLTRVGDVYLASQPSPADYRELKERGVQTVINLRNSAEEPGIDAASISKDLGLSYVNPAFSSPEQLGDRQFDETRAALNKAQGPVLLHCGTANRVGAMWLVWRVLDGGKDYQTALMEAKQIGLRSEKFEAKSADYIVRHGGTVK